MSVLFHLAIKRLDCTSIRGCTISNAQGATATMHIIRSDGNGRCGAIPHRSRLPTIKIVFESAVDDQFDGFIGRRRSHSDSRWKYSPHATQHGCSRSSNHTTGFPCLQYVNVINHSVPFPGMMEGDSPPIIFSSPHNRIPRWLRPHRGSLQSHARGTSLKGSHATAIV